MASTAVAAISAFIDGAPPGELTDVVNDIKALTPDQPSLLSQATPAFKKYNEEHLTVVKLPGSGENVIISAHNALPNGRYYDTQAGKSWAFDHATQKASDVQDHAGTSDHPHDHELVAALSKSLALHAQEHYPTSTHTVLPSSSDDDGDSITLLLVSNKYSPSNFWNGRLRTQYTYAPATGSLSGSLKCDVHYYEDGNVRLTTTKILPAEGAKVSAGGGATPSGADVVREIGKVERKWQEELNRGFGQLSEGSFKGLRRQLPVTRQKMEWEKVGGLRVGREIGGLRR